MNEQKYNYCHEEDYFTVNLTAVDEDDFAADSYRAGFMDGLEAIISKLAYDRNNFMAGSIMGQIVDDLRLERCSVEDFWSRFNHELTNTIGKSYKVRRGPSKGSVWEPLNSISGLSFHTNGSN